MPLVPRSWASSPVNSSTIKTRKATNKLATLIALHPTDNPVQSLPGYPLLLLHPWPLFPLSSICNNKSTDCQGRRLSTFLPTCSFRLVQSQTTSEMLGAQPSMPNSPRSPPELNPDPRPTRRLRTSEPSQSTTRASTDRLAKSLRSKTLRPRRQHERRATHQPGSRL
jgi:hypothetical protein